MVQYIQKQQSEEFYPWPFTETCDGGSSLDMPDIPQCFPSACNSDEAALKAILADSMTSDEPDDESDTDSDSGPVCTISDFILSGLATVNVSTESPTPYPTSSPTPPDLFKASKKSKKEGKAAKKAKNNKTAKKTKKVGV